MKIIKIRIKEVERPLDLFFKEKWMKNIFFSIRCFLLFFYCSLAAFIGAQESADPRIEEVLNYWFDPGKDLESKNKLWFGKSEATDQEIRNKFEPLVIAASKNELTLWTSTPKGRLVLIILLDQFPRNIYRNTPKAFEYDPIAQQLTLEGIEKGEDLQLLPIERIFFYLPLKHAENLSLQKLSVAKFSELLSQISETQKANFNSYLDYAQSHYKIIEKFGRFPHRNTILNRPSTQEEIDFLKSPNSSF